MEKPKISWHVQEEIDVDQYEFVQYKTYDEEGSYVPSETIEKTIQVWNTVFIYSLRTCIHYSTHKFRIPVLNRKIFEFLFLHNILPYTKLRQITP